MGDSGDFESYDEGTSTDDVTKQEEDASDNLSFSGQTGEGGEAVKDFRSPEVSDDDYRGVESGEVGADLTGMTDVPDKVAVGEVELAVPTPVVDVGGQQSIQSVLPAEPVVPLEPLPTVEPTFLGDAITSQDTTYYDYPVYYEDPTYYDYPVY